MIDPRKNANAAILELQKIVPEKIEALEKILSNKERRKVKKRSIKDRLRAI